MVRKTHASLVLTAVLGVASWHCVSLLSRAQGPEMSKAEISSVTPWRPNTRDARYVGREACAACHESEARTQPATVMGRALEPASNAEILSSHERLTFNSGPYSYQILRRGNQSVYSVTDGKSTISEPILYAFGQGKAGQTYVFSHNGSFYESRLSFYKEIQALDYTIGYPRVAAPSLEVAAGRAISSDEARNCFTCHGTGITAPLQLGRLIPGVSCEACHGPGGQHVEAMKAGDLDRKHIFNPGNMSPDELSQEFCGSCHRSAEQVTTNSSLRGIISIRFQPYRSFTSHNHDPFDKRLSCIACHNPHEDLRRDVAFYDTKCFSCHRSTTTKPTPAGPESPVAKPCRVAAKDCVSCHIPKVELPGSHFKFTDHRIRIVRAGEPFPN